MHAVTRKSKANFFNKHILNPNEYKDRLIFKDNAWYKNFHKHYFYTSKGLNEKLGVDFKKNHKW